MTTQICPTCQNPMRFVPAGISRKTGKSYNGFWACDNKCPKLPKTQINAPTAIVGANSAIREAQEHKAEQIEQAQDRKAENIKEAGAIRIAGDYANLMLELQLITPEQWMETFDKKAGEIYKFRIVPF